MDPVLQKTYSIKSSEVPAYAKHLMLGGGTRGGPLLVRGKGCWVEDIDGKKYIDCTSQSWALYLGYANDEINAIVGEHMQNLSHVHQGFDTLPRFALARKLAELAPQGLEPGVLHRRRRTCRRGGHEDRHQEPAGCPGVPLPLRLLPRHHAGHHGRELAVHPGGREGSWRRRRYNRLTKQFIRVPNPYCYRCPLGLKRESCAMMCLKVLRTTDRARRERPGGRPDRGAPAGQRRPGHLSEGVPGQGCARSATSSASC